MSFLDFVLVNIFTFHFPTSGSVLAMPCLFTFRFYTDLFELESVIVYLVLHSSSDDDLKIRKDSRNQLQVGDFL